ncbi:FecCD family ABC transporter permease [Vagococcus carniphilus]|uniref:Iron ABC transporter permease n=1 Tax=Vagococcus carniphilus TaxID=218144 RepID=A0A430ASS6_9ENTE|nr:iron ABC transporter permease [Vagococcus carniphilus]MDT2849023.1 iron ABC transporter permease [Vagococcus carniphilus]QNN73168.1 iron ABC transporter permease [Vagococcus carniphilus]RSU11103.1 iron ABC transporter permease [Vagococcus carniphilus]
MNNINKWNVKWLILVMTLLLGVTALLALCIGRYWISPQDVIRVFLIKGKMLDQSLSGMEESVIFTLRLPRILAAILIGSSLALSGAVYQGIFRNPLVSPDMLGVSAGACVGAAAGILLGVGSQLVQLTAFLGGLVAVWLAMFIPKLVRNNTMIILVLSGVIVGGLMTAILGMIKYMADAETELAEITYWQMGSIAKVSMTDLVRIFPVILFATVLLLALSWQINILSLGVIEAKTLGINVTRVRTLAILGATLLTASSVSISGTVGWVGLVIPHLGRMIIGDDNRRLLPVACLLGAIFMIVVDTLARVLTSAELPLSILTGLIGAPFYVLLLLKQRTRLV